MKLLKSDFQRLMVIVVSLVALMMIVWTIILTRPARADICLSKIDNTVEKQPGYKWMWRNVDGRKCWYYSKEELPVTDLIWSYTDKDFNSDVDRVIERKFYRPWPNIDDGF